MAVFFDTIWARLALDEVLADDGSVIAEHMAWHKAASLAHHC